MWFGKSSFALELSITRDGRDVMGMANAIRDRTKEVNNGAARLGKGQFGSHPFIR